MKQKVFKTIDEQIDILKNRGMIINDVDKAKELLLRENYFFINGYRHIFIKNKKEGNFIPGVTFEELYAVFQFVILVFLYEIGIICGFVIVKILMNIKNRIRNSYNTNCDV